MEPLLEDVPERIDTERLLLRMPRGDDAAAINAAVSESFDDLGVHMPWAQTVKTLAQSHAECRRMQPRFPLREDVPMFMLRVEVRMDDRNQRNSKVAQRAGFAFEGSLRSESLDPSGAPRDTRIYALSNASTLNA